ncbi:Protein argonaute 4A [Stylosanthes scabra]|uniref:Protein argonaute 4A n=1 Tax=Stylosanthes scabra TaxID=79078 RepID=A0ABU6TY46_9FABA|nr:Protein argonaute 4A [Stylosanthes scabra]
MNSFLSMERPPSIPLLRHQPTIILGMDVSHGAPGRSDAPSIAAVVSSRYHNLYKESWPSISCCRAAVRTQSPRVEMIQSLYKPVGNKDDQGIIRELLIDFYETSNRIKPQQIIIFRDGVSESQFIKVLNEELAPIMKACKRLDDKWSPKFTFIVAQKNHHTKFFEVNSPDNVPPGTVVDTKICHPKNNDFYMCAHAGRIGTTRPTHYHVLHDEIEFSADEMQELVHSLSYVYQRSTNAISIVAPIYYAHLAAAQMGQFIKNDELPPDELPQLPRLHEDVANSMFFC